MKFLKYLFMLAVIQAPFIYSSGQEVPYGINYQAVARDSYGSELTNQSIEIRFTVLSSTPLGTVEYQEVHYEVSTSRYGVFSATIGRGTPIMGVCESFSEISWQSAPHYLKVEIKFSNEFLEMGTMQFLSVPYALYAQKSLEPGPAGPAGPKGDPGDPATDDQTLSFDGQNLAISGGNTINLDGLTQYLSLKDDTLSITNGNFVTFSKLDVNDDDADPLNEIQDLRLENDVLRLTNNDDPSLIGLSPYLDNTDEQTLSFNAPDSSILISNGNSIDLSGVLSDDDTSAENELISDFSLDGTELVINEGGNENRVDLSSNTIAFRSLKQTNTDAAMPLSNVDFIPDTEEFNDGLDFNMPTGEFTASLGGIYIFDIRYSADGDGSGRKLMVYKNGNLYETLGTDISPGAKLYRSVTMKLNSQDRVKLVIHTGTNTSIGTGSFSGYKVY